MTDEQKIVSFRPPPLETSLSLEERKRLLLEKVAQRARLPVAEWMLYLADDAKRHDIALAELKAMIEATVKENEKKARVDKGEARQREQRKERQQAAAQREAQRTEDRQQREQRRVQQEADREAERKQRELDEALAEIAKLPTAVHEQKLTALAGRTGKDLNFLRGELSQLIAAEVASTASDIDYVEPWSDPVNTYELLEETLAQLQRFIAIPNDDTAVAIAIVLWIAFAWLIGIAVKSPRLKITKSEGR
jgi:hypothetical protein